MADIQDRRQRKTREAIFRAFTSLISQKNYDKITVGEIIELADVGRATFYAHFETKDYLLKEFCGDLFCHIFDSLDSGKSEHRHIFNCDVSESVFLHLFRHIRNNDNNIIKLLSCPNNELFLGYFKAEFIMLIESQDRILDIAAAKKLPKSFYLNYISSTFTETVKWWIENGCGQTAEEIHEYFLALL